MKIVLLALACVNPLPIDGDTVLCNGKDRVRLLGYDTPELHSGPQHCRRKAVQAWWRLTTLLDAPGWRIVPKRTRDGRMVTDRYRRILAWLWLADGRDVADVMIGEGLAKPYKGGRREPRC